MRGFLISIALIFLSRFAFAAVPPEINFQGRLALPRSEMEPQDSAGNGGDSDKGSVVPFTGTGRFKFAVVNSSGAVLWTNSAGSLSAPPSNFVALDVKNGIFNVALGDPALGMPPLTPAIFDGADRKLRVFFKAEIRDEQGRLKRLTAERELLPAQPLLAVPYALRAAAADTSIDQTTIENLLSGGVVQGTVTIQHAILRTAAIGNGTIHIGPSDTAGALNTITYDQSGAINTTGGKLTVDADGGLSLNSLSTGIVTMASFGGPSGRGLVGIGTDTPLYKLHVSSGAGPDKILVVTAGASNVFSVDGQGGVTATKFYGDGSALTGITGVGSIPSEIAVDKIDATPTTTNGGVTITSNVIVSGGLYVHAGGGFQWMPDGTPVLMRFEGGDDPVTGYTPYFMSLEDKNNPANTWTIDALDGYFDIGRNFDPNGTTGVEFGPDFASMSAASNSQSSGINVTPSGSSVSGNLDVIGNLTVTGTKSFVHQDPKDPAKEIVYYTLEGPEYGTYTRGTARLDRGQATIDLPSVFTDVTSSTAPITVNVTPLDDCNGLWVARKSAAQITVRELNGGRSNASFDWMVMGVRAGFETVVNRRDKVAMPKHSRMSDLRRRHR